MIVCDYLVFVLIYATGERRGPVLRPACLRAREPRAGGCPFVGRRSVWRSGGDLAGAHLSAGVVFGAPEMVPIISCRERV